MLFTSRETHIDTFERLLVNETLFLIIWWYSKDLFIKLLIRQQIFILLIVRIEAPVDKCIYKMQEANAGTENLYQVKKFLIYLHVLLFLVD